jgi:glutathione S-transferase
MRARLAISAARVNVELREIVLRDKPKAMLEASPKGTVPVAIVGESQVIDESLDIGLWALRKNDPAKLLEPEEGDLDAMLALIYEQDSAFKPLLDRYKYHFHSDRDAAIEARDNANGFLSKLNDRLEGQAYLFGQRRALADICTAPFIRQFAHVDKDYFWSLPLPNLIAWLDRFLASDEFAQIMPKFALWQEGDAPIYFPNPKSDAE